MEKRDHSIKERTTQKEKKCFSAIGSEKEKYHISINNYFWYLSFFLLL
jgi:hypothetical protein